MSDTPKIEPLLKAAQQLDDELQRFGKLVNAACKGELGSRKEIERTAAALQEATAVVAEIEAKTQGLIRSLQMAQSAQQGPIDRLRARAELLQRRHEEHEALRARFRELGGEAAALTELAQSLAGATQSAVLEVDVVAPMSALKARLHEARAAARTLTQDSRELRFEEIAREVHSFEQILGALERKIDDVEESMSKMRAQVQS